MQIKNDFHLPWSKADYLSFGLKPQIHQHPYHKLEIFQPEALMQLLDNYPRHLVRAFTMGTDPCDSSDWGILDIPAETSGREIWQAVANGRIWINILYVEQNHPLFSELITTMYQQLNEFCPHLQNPRPAMSNLLISSPNAMVYYHLDAEPNMLWHISGEKTIWLYPELDLRFVSQDKLENIFAGEAGENLPFQTWFDEHAQQYLLKPGQVASWPQNAPHRIVNKDLNVSLATSYYAENIYKRIYTQLANKYVMRKLGISVPSMRETGAFAACKRFTYRALNKVRPFKQGNFFKREFTTNLRLDAQEALGFRVLTEDVVPHFRSR